MVTEGNQPSDQVELSYPLSSSERIWEGAVFGLREDLVTLPGASKPVIRQYLDHGGAVAVVAIRDGGVTGPEVLLQRQYRHPVRAHLWEIPAGLLDKPGEDPLSAAKRELREEADLTASKWKVLVDLYTSPGASSESLRIFLAWDLRECAEPFPRQEEEAAMVSRWIPLKRAVRAVLSGQIHSPTAIAGVLAAQTHFSDESLPLRDAQSPRFPAS